MCYIISNNGTFTSMNQNGEIVNSKNPMDLCFLEKEAAFELAKALRASDPTAKIRVKVVSQALRDMITDIILNQLPVAECLDSDIVRTTIKSWAPQPTVPKAASATKEEEIEAAWAEFEK